MYKLLIVDDEPLERETLELFVKQSKLPIECLKAKNGKEAVKIVSEAAKDDPIHIIFFDIQMPVMTGMEAAEIIHAEKPNILIVFLTAWGVFDLAQQAIRNGAQDYLVKPVKKEAIIDVLTKMIEKLENTANNTASESSETKTILIEGDSLRKLRVTLVESILEGNEPDSQMIAQKIIQSCKQTSNPLEQLKQLISALLKTIESHIISCSFVESPTNNLAQATTFLKSIISQSCTIILEEKRNKYERFFSEIGKYITTHYNQQLEIEDFAKQIDITPYYFSKLFKDYVGISFIEYLRTVRLAEAKKLLAQKIPVSKVSSAVGYTDTAYFSRIFKEEFGVSPKQYKPTADITSKKAD